MPRPLRRGLGDDSVGDDSGGTYTDSGSLPGTLVMGPTQDTSGTTDLSSLFSSEGLSTASVPSLTGGASQTGYVAPSQSSANWAAFATALSNSGMKLAEINAIQPGTVVSANGAILRQATGLPVPVGTGITAALGSSSSTLLLLGGAALLVMFMVMGNKSR
jgi:hypothetical protein